jgi:hypothetical protein
MSKLQRASDRAAAFGAVRLPDRRRGHRNRCLDGMVWEPPCTLIHTREKTLALPDEAVLLGQPRSIAVQRRSITHRCRGAVLCDARSIVWLDSPVLPPASVNRLRSGGQTLAVVLRPLGLRRHTMRVNRLLTTASRWITTITTGRCCLLLLRSTSRMSVWRW